MCDRAIESCFKAFLKLTVQKSDLQLPFKYTAAMSSVPETFFPLHFRDSVCPALEEPSTEAIDLKILTPLFYRHLARCSHISEFITSSLIALPAKSQTFYISDPQAFLGLLSTRPKVFELKNKSPKLSRLDNLRWRCLRWLRSLFLRSRATIVSPQGTKSIIQDIRPFPLSMLDEFAQESQDRDSANAYRRAVTKLLLSDAITFGQAGVIDAFDLLVRVMLSLVSIHYLGLGLPLMVGTADGKQGQVPDISATVVRIILGCSGVHLWWAFKALF